MNLRALRRDRASRTGAGTLSLRTRLRRLPRSHRRSSSAALTGASDRLPRSRDGPRALASSSNIVDVLDPGVVRSGAGGDPIDEDELDPPELVLRSVPRDRDTRYGQRPCRSLAAPPAALRRALSSSARCLAATRFRNCAPRCARRMQLPESAAPHVHPRIEAAALAPLLGRRGFTMPVVDVDRVPVSYEIVDRLVDDLRAIGATNILAAATPASQRKRTRAAAALAFASAGNDGRTIETFEILHFAAWTHR